MLVDHAGVGGVGEVWQGNRGERMAERDVSSTAGRTNPPAREHLGGVEKPVEDSVPPTFLQSRHTPIQVQVGSP